MFEWLAQYDKILVTGPHRSGTRICAKMIAYDTGHEYIDEVDIAGDSLTGLGTVCGTRQRFVVQCPALSRHIHMFSDDDTAIVFMRRNIEDIVASQKRVGWRGEWLELARYDRTDGVVAKVKYRFWEERQQGRITHAFEIEYTSLAEHPLWYPKHLRGDFEIGQTGVMSQDLQTSAYLCRYKDVLYEEGLHDVAAILVKDRPAKFLNATARLIWSLCDGTRTRQDILQTLRAHFTRVEEGELACDLDAFIDEMVSHRFLFLSARKRALGVETNPELEA